MTPEDLVNLMQSQRDAEQTAKAARRQASESTTRKAHFLAQAEHWQRIADQRLAAVNRAVGE